jgi:hypothetical protein
MHALTADAYDTRAKEKDETQQSSLRCPHARVLTKTVCPMTKGRLSGKSTRTPVDSRDTGFLSQGNSVMLFRSASAVANTADAHHLQRLYLME